MIPSIIKFAFFTFVLMLPSSSAADDACNALRPREDFDNDKVSKGLWFEVLTSSYEYNSACVNLYIEYNDTNICTLLSVKDKDSNKMKYWKSVLRTTPTKGMYVGPDDKHAIIWKTDYENYYVFIMCAKNDDDAKPPQRIITFATRSEQGEINDEAKKAFEATKKEMTDLGIDVSVLKPVDFKDCQKATTEDAAAIAKKMVATIGPVDFP